MDKSGESASEQQPTAGRASAEAGRRRRSHGSEPRRRQVVIRLGEVEYALVQGVADQLGMAPGAWVADIAVRCAGGVTDPVPASWRDLVGELVRFRVDVSRAGSVINQVARVANSTGRLDHQAGGLLALAERMLRRVDEVISVLVAKANAG